MGNVKSILFVCTGNSCRSIMAEGLLKKSLKTLGKGDIVVRSAGVGAMYGVAPADSTIEVMKEDGIDVSAYRSRKLTEEMIKDADLVLVMEEVHLHDVIRMASEAISKTYLLKSFGLDAKSTRPEGLGVPDPIGRPMKDYETCYNMIKKEIERIARIL